MPRPAHARLSRRRTPVRQPQTRKNETLAAAGPARTPEKLSLDAWLRRAELLGHRPPPPVSRAPAPRVSRMLAVDEPPPREAMGEAATLSIWEALQIRGFSNEDIEGLRALQRQPGFFRFATWREAADAGRRWLAENREGEELESSGSLSEEEQLSEVEEETSSASTSEEREVLLLEEEEEEASAIVRLPPLRVDDPRLVAEASRQLELQLEALERMSARQWLINLLLNRMKTPEQQIQEDYGTETGKRLAAKIDHLLRRNRRLAVLLMQAIVGRVGALSLGAESEVAKLLQEIREIAEAAGKTDEVYLEFRRRGGLERMALLSEARLRGGLGRQHGEGDERSFRENYAEGVELVKQSDPTFAKNACLHNPDQCAGGPMEILWQAAQRMEIERAREWYRGALRRYGQARYLTQSYESRPPRTTTGEVDKRKVGDAEDERLQLEDELEQAEAFYMQQVKLYIGNYGVNSLLGRNWMEALRLSGAINRVDMILDAVLQIRFQALASTRMSVLMDVVAPRSSSSREPSSSSSSISSIVLSSTSARARRGRKRRPRKGVQAERLRKAQEARTRKGGRQLTIEDTWYRKRRKKPIPPPPNLVQQAQEASGRTWRKVSGDGMACYIRSLATWLARNGHIEEEHIEDAVGNIGQVLAQQNLRIQGEMVDAGGLAAAVVRDLVNRFGGVDVYITIVQWNYDTGGLVQFDANEGTNQVFLLYTPGHFDLLE